MRSIRAAVEQEEGASGEKERRGGGGLSWRGSLRRETESRSEWQIGTLKEGSEKSDFGYYRRHRARPTHQLQPARLYYVEGARMTQAQLADSQKALARSAEMRLSLSVARSVERSIGAAFLLAVPPSVPLLP